ncbi:uncharacterized protein LOC144429896 [Styela clava]
MGSNQSKTSRVQNRKRGKKTNGGNTSIRSPNKSEGPIKTQDHKHEPIRTHKHNSKQKLVKENHIIPPIIEEDSEIQPFRSREVENRPIKTRSKDSIPETVDRGTNTDSKDIHNGKKTNKKQNKQDKNSKKTEINEESKNEKEKLKSNAKEENKRIRHKKQKEQIEKEKKIQRVTKEQLRSLSTTLLRTSWYLGKRLGMDESQVKRCNINFATEQERKYQMLLWWRRVRGWKATIQQLVIVLELGHYSTDEYAAIVTSSNGDVTIYEKAPDLSPELHEQNHNNNNNGKREPYHYDETKYHYEEIKPHGRSYGNMNYDSTVEAQTYDRRKERERIKSKEHRRKEYEQKHRSKHRHKDRQYQTLPPWWKKPADSLDKEMKRLNTEQRKRAGSKDVVYDQVPEEVRRESESQAPTNEDEKMRRESPTMHDGNHSNESHTDDSGIVTSPPMSPKEGSNQSEARKYESHAHNITDPTYNRLGQSDEIADNEVIIKKDPKRASKTLIVRRCSDSVVKLRYGESSEKKTRVIIPAEPPIEEHESAKLTKTDDFAENDNDVTKLNVTYTHNHNTKKGESDVTNKNGKAKKAVNSDITLYKSDITKSNNDVKTSNNDITEDGYNKNIRSMIEKYESLTKLNQAESRESLASNRSITRNHFTAKTLPKNFTTQTSKRASQSSLASSGSNKQSNYRRHRSESYDTLNNSHHQLTGRQRHDKQPRYVPRYHFFTFGGKGKFPSRFKGLISGLTIFDNGDIVTSDGDNRRVQIFDKRGKFLTTFDTNTELKPKGICMTPDNRIAVCCGDAVNVYDKEGRKHLSFGQGVFRNNSYCVCCDTKGNYYVTDIVSHTISVHDIKGRIRKRFGFQGSSMIHFNQPVSLAINSQNKLYISDSQNHCIKVYTLAGRPLYRIGAKGSSDGLFWNPLGICLDDSDHLYVADCGNNRISEFDEEGNFTRQVLTAADGLWMPSLVQMNKRGQLVICEWEKQFIKVFSIETEV